MRSVVSRVPPLVLILLLCLVASPASRAQNVQNIPPEVQEELNRRGMTLEQAKQEAARLGIDLSNPQQAAQRARQLGIPESEIQRWLQVAEQANMAPAGNNTGLSSSPDTSGGYPEDVWDPNSTHPLWVTEAPVLNPTHILPSSTAQRVSFTAPLTGNAASAPVVRFLLTGPAKGDTIVADAVEKMPGTGRESLWRGIFVIPPDATPGQWDMWVYTLDLFNNEAALRTGATLTILEDPSSPLQASGTEPLTYFGYNTFENVPRAFYPGAIESPSGDYIVGPEDELRLTLWGAAEFQYDLPVDKEGRVLIPRVGQITVAGRSLDQLRDEMRLSLSRSYAGLVGDPPSIFMDLSITRMKPIRLFVLGEVERPGGYTLPSGSNLFSVLYSVGGPLTRGSLRNVQIIRDGVPIAADLYDYLLRGYGDDPVQLQTGDHIFIPPRGKTVTIEGAVLRPAIYELKEGETFEDLLRFAGGLKAEAYTKRFQIERIVPFSKRSDPAVARTVLDFDLSAVLSGEQTISLEDGDHVTISSIRDAADLAALSRVPSVTVTGAVFKPGRYQLGEEVRTVRDLIERADGLTGDAYKTQARLVRLAQDLRREVTLLDLNQVMNDVPTQNLVLRPQDSLHVLSGHEVVASRTVKISGQVRKPGEYRLLEQMTVGDLLLQAGGLEDPIFLKDVFLERADLFRRSLDGRKEEIIPFDLAEALQGRGMATEVLRPEDEIRIYPAVVEVGRIADRYVTISGAVKKPGRYRYRDGMTLQDLILQSDGFQEGAHLESIDVTRPILDGSGEATERAREISVPVGNFGSVALASTSPAGVNTNSSAITAETFVLQHRDEVFVRTNPAFKEPKTVTVRGEVQFPGEYTLLLENETLADVIERAGGVKPSGYIGGGKLMRGGTQLVIEMGDAVARRSAHNVILQDGDEIIIPSTPNTVAVRGNVALEGLIKHVPGRRLSYYLDRAGGVKERTEAIYLTQASGATYRVKTGWMRRTPVVEDGASILVTAKPPRKEGDAIDYGSVITETMAILSSALTIIVLGRQALR